jgi:dihydrofolate reductase
MTEDRVIGNGPDLPWKIPEELKFFKMMTLGQTIILGANTLDSIGRLLPNRNSVVLSRKPQSYFNVFGECFVFDNFEKALQYSVNLTKDVYICGGANVYKQALENDYAEELIISTIKKNYSGDVYFPEFHSFGWMAKEVIFETDSFVTKRYKK